MDQTVDAIWKGLLGRLQKDVLKARGFKKSGNNVRLFLPNGISKIINFQRSSFNSDGECSFTINVGLYLQKDTENPDLRFKEYECQIRTRVAGISRAYKGDHWWVITEVTDGDKLYAELLRLLEQDVLPWLDQFRTHQDIIRVGRTGALRGMVWGSVYMNI